MTTTTGIEVKITNELELLSSKTAEFHELAKQSVGLTISGVDDKEGYEIVKAQGIKLQKARTAIETIRKDYTAQFDEKKQRALDIQNSLLAIIGPSEEALKAERKRIDEAREQIRLEAERKSKEKLNSRVAALASVETNYDLFELECMGDDTFDIVLSNATASFEVVKAQRLADQEARIKYEAERSAFEADKAKFEAEKNAKAQAEAIEKAKEQARIDTEARIAGETQARKDREELEARMQVEKAEKEKAELEAQTKYKKWLSDNGVTAENKTEYQVRDEEGVKVLYKRISTY